MVVPTGQLWWFLLVYCGGSYWSTVVVPSGLLWWFLMVYCGGPTGLL